MILKFASYRNGSIVHGCIGLRSGEPIGLQVTIRADAMTTVYCLKIQQVFIHYS